MMCTEERFYVYFICDPRKPHLSDGDYKLTYEPFYCGKGTFSRIKSKKNKAVNDKIKSLSLVGVEPVYTWIGPYNEQSAFELEQYFVDMFKRRDLYKDGVLLNLQDGGFGGNTPSIESRQKMSNSHKGHIPWNKGLKGAQVAWNKGVPQPEGRMRKLVERRKELEALGEYTVWNKGKKYRRGSGTKNSKKVMVNGVEYCSLSEASEQTGLSLYLIRRHHLKEQP